MAGFAMRYSGTCTAFLPHQTCFCKTMKTVLSAIQPTSEMHIGNYFGAVKNWVRLQDEGQHRCIYGVVDLHAMTMPYDAQLLHRNTQRMALDLLACGIDTSRSILFVQSLVPEHTELTWILNCVASFGQLSRMTQFKDKTDLLKEQQGAEHFISAGLFTYPILQAADILIYRAHYVPVGQDQKQHLELSRNIAERFNQQFNKGEVYFPMPDVLFTEVPKVMSLADPTRKMSKSLGPKHFIGLFEEADAIRKKVAGAVTDSGGAARDDSEPRNAWYHAAPYHVPAGKIMSEGVENLFSILRACGKQEMMQPMLQQFAAGELKYKPLKDAVGDALVELTQALREKKMKLEENPAQVEQTIRESSERARAIARKTIEEVRSLTGLPRMH
jgi:tryptophanyl-tRNA synthetase